MWYTIFMILNLPGDVPRLANGSPKPVGVVRLCRNTGTQNRRRSPQKRRNNMGLFGALVDVVAMPLRVAVDVVKLPSKIVNGEERLMENTTNGIRKIEEDLDE